MNKVKQFMNKITEKTNGAQGSGEGTSSSSATFVDSEDQHSAEGFICPLCMTALATPEDLENHYQTSHITPLTDEEDSRATADYRSDRELEFDTLEIAVDIELDKQEKNMKDMKKEIIRLRDEVRLREEQVLKARQNEESAETDKLKKRLSTEIDQVGQLRLEKEILTRNISVSGSQVEQLKERIIELESQLVLNSAGNSDNTQVELMTQQLTTLQKSVEVAKLESERESSELKAQNKNLLDALESRKEELDKQVAKTAGSEDEAKKTLAELEIVKRDLSEAQKKAQMVEHVSNQLRTDVVQLREQHSELLRKFETGEDGKQAAMEELNKENQTLKESIDAAQLRLKEVSINSTNLQSELDKLHGEYKSLVETTESARKDALNQRNTLNAEINRQKEEFQAVQTKQAQDLKRALEKEADTTNANEALKNKLSTTIQDLESQLKIARAENDGVKEEIETTLKKIGAENLKELKLKFIDASNKEKALTLSLGEAKKALLQETNRIAELTQISQDLENKLKELQKSSKDAEALHRDKKVTLEAEISQLRKEMTKASDVAEALHRDKEACLEAEISQLRKELEDQKEDLSGKLTGAQSERDECKTKMEQLALVVDETDKLRTEKTELEKKYKASEEGKSLLLERCLLGEANSEKLAETIADLRRKLDDSQSALKELGRENQSLQVESAKLQGRKWADDSVVNNCSTCTKEFSLTIRKHHCRGCGNIFCNDCTARTASIPSSKKPVRVCDACYEELGSK